MLTNLLDLDNNLSVRDVHKEEKSSKRSTGVLNKIIFLKYCNCFVWSIINGYLVRLTVLAG